MSLWASYHWRRFASCCLASFFPRSKFLRRGLSRTKSIGRNLFILHYTSKGSEVSPCCCCCCCCCTFCCCAYCGGRACFWGGPKLDEEDESALFRFFPPASSTFRLMFWCMCKFLCCTKLWCGAGGCCCGMPIICMCGGCG